MISSSAQVGDVGFWGPHVAGILERHGLPDAAPVAGFNPTYPTFLCGDVVVKLFGGSPNWCEAHSAERAALDRLSTEPEILTPGLLGWGSLSGESWPYLISGLVPGVAWHHAGLSAPERLSAAAELGGQVRRVHALPPPDGLPRPDLRGLDLTAALVRSSLSPHLVAQADDFVEGIGIGVPVFVHADLVAAHAFVRDGRLTGVIDWGDAVAADPYLELAQIHRDTFDCDKALLRAFLDAYNWPDDAGFPRRALAFALFRQAHGLTQHHSIDVFVPVAARFPLQDIATLDDLATELFGV
ncbi:phosphotransferase family protein [Spirillospora sp. NBC_01491]|uniref:phosphotransferase family protein n=1 Tax=Spirillospora sp. NBC_01491 TaxID=2976007 RepID=UPI002E30DD9D|nr:phosphotransferase [Spirillospora sp. NBC_01491]